MTNFDVFEIQHALNENGGEDSLIGNTFAGRGRLKAHEMETFLLGILEMAERVKAAEVRT